MRNANELRIQSFALLQDNVRFLELFKYEILASTNIIYNTYMYTFRDRAQNDWKNVR